MLVDEATRGAVVAVEDLAPSCIADGGGLAGRFDDVGEEDGRESPGRRPLDRLARDELDRDVGDLAPVGHDPEEVVGAFDLDVPRAGDDVGEQPAHRDRQHPIALHVHHHGRGRDPFGSIARVEGEHAVELALEVLRARREPHQPGDPSFERLVSRLARELPPDHEARILAPRLEDALEVRVELAEHEGRVIVSDELRNALEVAGRRDGVDECHRLDPFREVGGEELRHDPALRLADDVRTLPSQRVHHREDVLVALLERGSFVEAIRHADAALVEPRKRHVAAHVLERTPVQLVLPRDLDVGDEVRDVQHRRPLTPCLVRDPEVTRAGVANVGYLHGGTPQPRNRRPSQPAGRPDATPRGMPAPPV